MAVVGVIMGGTALAGLPLQPLAGSLSDRFGRRAVLIVCCCCSGVMYGGLAFAHGFWPICLAVFCDRALGWPLFLTASNAMVADLVRTRLRPEGYSLVRLMIGAGEIVGPLIAAVLLAAGCGLSLLFLLAGAGCFIFLVFVVAELRETRPRAGPPRALDGGERRSPRLRHARRDPHPQPAPLAPPARPPHGAARLRRACSPTGASSPSVRSRCCRSSSSARCIRPSPCC